MARAIRESVCKLGIETRAGLRTGECELMEDDIGGIAVHMASRVAAQARPSEILVSSTVKDLVAWSGPPVHRPWHPTTQRLCRPAIIRRHLNLPTFLNSFKTV